jgi:hypothetical protein
LVLFELAFVNRLGVFINIVILCVNAKQSCLFLVLGDWRFGPLDW